MSVVRLNMYHPATGATVTEKRFVLTQTVESMKANIATHFQTSADNMVLVLKNEFGAVVEADMKNEKMLGYYQVPADGWSLDVRDTAPAATQAQYLNFNDLSQVEKFEMTEDEYLKRPNNIRALREQKEAAMRAHLESQGIEVPKALDDDSFKEEAAKIKVGDRCQVFPGDRLATVRYVGRVPPLKPGFWVGVEYDEPVGKNDGSIAAGKGKPNLRLFQCNPNYGGIVRPEQVTVGDFPAEEF
jgi:tubulin-folding cofactor B